MSLTKRTPPASPATIEPPPLPLGVPEKLGIETTEPGNKPLQKNLFPEKNKFLSSSSSSSRDPNVLQHSDSVPDLRAFAANFAERKKRKYEEADGTLTNQMMEMFKALSEEQNKHFHQLQTSVNDLRAQNNVLTKSVETMSNRNDEFLEKIHKLESERIEDKKIITYLEEKIEILERKTRITGVEFRNVPKIHGEKKEDVLNVVTKVLKVLNIDVQPNDIKDTYRLNTKDSTASPIITEFTTVFLRDKVLRTVKDFNKKKGKGERLNTQHINPHTPMRPVYVSETLTQKAQRLFYLARMFQKTHDYDFCWTSNGTVYLRKKENLPQIKITSEADIEQLKRAV